MNIAQELQKRELHIDAYLKATDSSCQDAREQFYDNFGCITLTKQGFPVHRLILASVSPFLKMLFQDHYSDHREGCITVLLPNTSSSALYHIILYMYTSEVDIPQYLFQEVLSLAHTFQIDNLILKLDPGAKLNNRKPVVVPFAHKRRRGRRARIKRSADCLPVVRTHRRIRSKYDSDTYELQFPTSRRKQNNYPPTVLPPSSRNLSENNYINNENVVLNVPLTETKYTFNNNQNQEPTAETEKCTLENAEVLSSEVWINPQNNNSQNLICLDKEPRYDIILLTNSVNSSQPMLNSLALSRNQQESLFPVAPDVSVSKDLRQKSVPEDLALIEYPVLSPCDSFPEISCVPASVTNASLLAINSGKEDKIEISSSRDSFDPDTPGQIGGMESSEVGLELCHRPNQEEEEEEKLKLQVLLKECEVMDLGGRPFVESPSTLMKNSSAAELPAPTTDDFTDRFTEWIHYDKDKHSKELELDPLENKNKEDALALTDRLSLTDSAVKKEQERRDSVTISDGANCQKPKTAMMKNSDSNQKLACKKCSFVASSKSDLSTHKAEHRKRLLECKFCGKTFKSRSRFDLVIHEARHGTPSRPCQMCSKVFKLEKDLKVHMKTHSNRTFFSCEICDKKLTSKRSLKLHVAKIHEKQKPHACNLCPKVYSKMISLKVHTRAVHTNERPYRCSLCEKAFASTDNLAVHKQAVHTTNLKYKCAVCQKGFKTFANLFRHKKTHLLEKRFTCIDCKLQFQTQLLLLRHRLTHKKLSQPLKCRLCDQVFEMKQAYEWHMLKTHKEKVRIAEVNVKKIINSKEDGAKLVFSTLKNSGPSETILQNIAVTGLVKSKTETIQSYKPIKLLQIPFRFARNPDSTTPQSIKLNTITNPCSSRQIMLKPSSLAPRIPSEETCIQTSSSFSTTNSGLEKDDFLQISDPDLPDFSLTREENLSLVNRESNKLWPYKDRPSLDQYSEGVKSKYSSSANYKMVEHIGSFSYNLQTSSFDIGGAGKDSNFSDTFSKSSEDDNVDKFLFGDLGPFEQ